MSKSINIFMSCDNNYAGHCGVTLYSALKNTTQTYDYQIFLIDNHISADNKVALEQVSSEFGALLHFIKADVERFKDIPAFRYGASAYQRLSLSELLPADVHKVIYLDCDILVTGDLAELWKTDTNGRPLAAVENFSPKAHQSLGFARSEYFNSGVLVMDVKHWREENFSIKAMEFITANKKSIKFVDQCALNHLYRNNWFRLEPEWNVQGDIFRVLKKYMTGCGYSKDQLLRASRAPKVIHFIGEQKPWTWACFSPYLRAYESIKADTPWKNTPKTDESLKNRLSHFLSLKKLITQYSRETTINL